MPQDSKTLNNSIAEIPVDSGDEGLTEISPKVAVLDKINDYENRNIVFSFTQYKQNQCGIHGIDKPDAKKLTGELRKINQTQAKNILCQQVSGVACKRVYNNGDYECLFSDLPEDVQQLLEIDFSGPGRIFGYLAENIFNVVSINRKHLK